MAGPLNIRRLMHFAQLAKATYNETIDRGAEDIARYPAITEISITEGKLKAVVFESDDKVVVAFRGTANIKNMLEDIEFFKTKDKYLGIHLHRGFRRAAQAMYGKLPKLSGNKSMYLTGHSLGGALAVIVGMYLLKDGTDVKGVYTFGQPKVTNAVGANMYDALPLIRVVNDMDIVPLLPPTTICTMCNPYKHFGAELYMSDDNPEGYGVAFGNDTHTSGSLKSYKRTLTNNVFENVKDHFMDGYLKQLQKRVDSGA